MTKCATCTVPIMCWQASGRLLKTPNSYSKLRFCHLLPAVHADHAACASNTLCLLLILTILPVSPVSSVGDRSKCLSWQYAAGAIKAGYPVRPVPDPH